MYSKGLGRTLKYRVMEKRSGTAENAGPGKMKMTCQRCAADEDSPYAAYRKRAMHDD